MTQETDKLEQHHLQQLSALMDGELPPDQARFLLRRLQHDEELAGCWDRWQLCGEVLRGQAQAPAPAGFAQRVALAVASELKPARLPAVAANDASAGQRHWLARWGGGALAASVALVALFMARNQTIETPAPSVPSMATQSPVASDPAQQLAGTATSADAAASVVAAAAAVASVPLRQDNAPRRSATRTQQAARASASRQAAAPVRVAAIDRAPPVALPGLESAAVALAPVAPANPFSTAAAVDAPSARPWPRSALPQYPAAGGFTAGYSSQSSSRAFYPFEPDLLPPQAASPEPNGQE